MRKEIDMTTYEKRNQYHWFRQFADPTYGFNVDLDVNDLVLLTKKRKQSFFIYFYYLILRAVDRVDEMKMREVDGKVYLYDVIHPTMTVMSEYGIYQNAGTEMDWDFVNFFHKVRAVIDEAKHLKPGDDLDRYPVCKVPNCLYTTSIPVLSVVSMTHPTPAGDYDSLSVPRICFDRYEIKGDGRYHVTLNITVSHTLVDGFPLARCFNYIKEDLKHVDEIFSVCP